MIFSRHKKTYHNVLNVTDEEMEKMCIDQHLLMTQARIRRAKAVNKAKAVRREAGEANVSSDEEIEDPTPEPTPSNTPR